MRPRVKRSKWWGDNLHRCEGCGGVFTDITRYISRGSTFTLCTKCFERVLRQESAHMPAPEGDDTLSREASYYHPA